MSLLRYAILGSAVWAIQPAQALSINLDFSQLGAVYQDTATGLLSNVQTATSQDVTADFRAGAAYAASTLDKAIGVNWHENITVTIGNLIGAVAQSSVTGIDSHGHPSSSLIVVDSMASRMFVDPTPSDNSEFTIGSRSADLGGGEVNVSRTGNAVAGSGAEGRWDLVTLLLHEMEHSVAYYAGIPGYNANVTGPGGNTFVISSSLTGLPSSFDLPVTPNGGSHIDGAADNGLFNETVISSGGFGPGQRALLTGAEIYGACLISGCTPNQVNIDPYQAQVSAVPLPASWSMMLMGVAALSCLTLTQRGAKRL